MNAFKYQHKEEFQFQMLKTAYISFFHSYIQINSKLVESTAITMFEVLKTKPNKKKNLIQQIDLGLFPQAFQIERYGFIFLI